MLKDQKEEANLDMGDTIGHFFSGNSVYLWIGKNRIMKNILF